MTVTPLPAVEPTVFAEVTAWTEGSSFRGYWCEVKGGVDGVGYHHAAVVYLGYLLSERSPRRIYSMHLIGDVEGRPNALRECGLR